MDINLWQKKTKRMELKESNKISIKLSLLLTGTVLIYFWIQYYFSISNIYFSILFVLIFSAISFWTIQLYIKKYIYDRIKVIYKIIHEKKSKKDEKQNPSKKLNESIDFVHQEVLDWSQDVEQEISHLKQLEEYRKEYIGNISHELKTPLFAIQGYVSTLIDGGILDENINMKYLEKSDKNINRLISIVDELEEINKLESGAIKLNYTRFNIKDLTDDTIESLELKAQNKDIRIYYAKTYESPIYTSADKTQIQRLIANLLSNAIKYGFAKTGKIKISFFDMDDKILLEITDNGPGINKEDLPRIFERFYRSEKARSRKLGGTGLGLAIVKHIIEAHKQTIYTRSTIGIGTTFGFTLAKD